MELNKHKYYLQHSDGLTEAEKIQMAKDLIELERQGVIEYRDGRWQLAAGVESDDTPEGLHSNREEKEEDATDGDRR